MISTTDTIIRQIDHAALIERYRQVRSLTEGLCTPLAIEDYVVQSMPDASPIKWHLAHTSWFFETFVLSASDDNYRPFHPEYAYLFNSYYNAIGDRVPRPQRGVLSRPLVHEVYEYRRYIDDQVVELLEAADDASLRDIAPTVALGLHHEQQHQELMLTDIKHAFACNPLRPAYREHFRSTTTLAPPLRWTTFPAGVRLIGHAGRDFAFDNETPRHRQFVEAFQFATRLVTNGEYRAFIEEGGYQRPQLWLSDGWDVCRLQNWCAPLYWENHDGAWRTLTLAGMQDINDAEPVCHVSYYEADAFARWAGARLASEFEWESAAIDCAIAGNLLKSDRLHPAPAPDADGVSQLFGDVWEWTSSPYIAYPGYRPAAGALGEYNGKFMCNQMVLRGGSCVTPPGHIRSTYRNFFSPSARWQFSGIRLAKDL